MKKLTGLTVFAAALMTAMSVFAFDITYTSISDDTVKITADTGEGSAVSVLVLNDGYTVEDILENPDAQQYFYAEETKADEFSREFRLISQSDKKQTLKIVMNVNGDVTTSYWDYYPLSMRLSIVSKLNTLTGSELESAFEEALNIYGLSTHTLCVSDVKSEALKILINRIKEEKLPEDVDKIHEILTQSLVTGAFNASKDELLIKDGILMYKDIAGFDSELYEDYSSCLSESGITGVNKEIMGKNYKSADELTGKFEELVLYGLIMNNVKSGYGHVGDVIEKYSDKYYSYGFNTSKKAGKSVYSELVKSNAQTLGKLKEKYNDLIDEPGTSKGTGGSRGSSSSLSPGSGYIPADNTASKDSVEIFSDLGSVEWAREAVLKLYEKGIVNGKATGVFAPQDIVTRAEFAKMISQILPDAQNFENRFEDMENHWARDYVARAYEAGIVKGISDTVFAPDASITREQGAVMIIRTLGAFGVEFELKDADIPDKESISEYAVEAVETLYANGIVNGMANSEFMPQNTMTRAEAAVMLSRMLDKIN